MTVVLETGSVLRKLEANVVLPIFEKDEWSDQDRFAHELAMRRGVVYQHPPKVKYWLRVSLPVLERRPKDAAYAVVRATPIESRDQKLEARTVVVEDLDAQAAMAFQEKEPAVLLRAIVRGLGKYVASESARKNDETLGALINLVGAATETADTRSWTTLPESVWAARLEMPEGRYRVDAEVIDARGRAVNRISFGEIDIRPGVSTIQTARIH